MRDCWKFFAGLFAGFLAALLLNLGAFALILGVPTENSRWTFEINRKKQEIAHASAPPRLLIVGGSGSLFGLSAREIEKKTGFRTLNLATHAALGTAYILENAKTAARPGDTVLLVLEYELYSSRGRSTVWLDYLVAREPKYFHRLSLADEWDIFMLTSQQRLIRGLKNRFNGWSDNGHPYGIGPYNPAYVDSWGDQSHHPRSAAPADFEHPPFRLAFPFPEHPDGFAFVESFCRWAQENHIRVLATYPNRLDQPEFRSAVAHQSFERIAALYKDIGVPVIGTYTDTLLPRDQFFDTVYHLTEEAALARTDRLAEKLKPILSGTNAPVRPE